MMPLGTSGTAGWEPHHLDEEQKPEEPGTFKGRGHVTKTKQLQTGEYPKATQQSYCSSPPGREDSNV